MRNKANENLGSRSGLVLVLGLAVALALAIWSPALLQSAEPAADKTPTEATMMERCQAMMAQKQKMMADMKAQDAELTEQVAQMNSAPQDKKINLMAAVLTRMVEQRTNMNMRMEKMQEAMMQHMMQHMQMGKDSMSQCPMMQGMMGMNKKPAATRSEHPDHPK